MPNDTFDPARAFPYLESSGAVSAPPVTEGFWPDIMAGRIKLDDGYLMITGDVTDDISHWENHPKSEEVLPRLSDAFDILIEGSDAPAPRLGEQQPAFIVPRNAWHQLTVVEPGEVVFINYGRGTQHNGL